MDKYVKCPVCDLNYMQTDEKCCKICSPEMRGKLIADAEREYEEYKQARWEEYQASKRSWEEFKAIRWNRKPC